MTVIVAIEIFAFSWSNKNIISKSLAGAALQTNSYLMLFETNMQHISTMQYDLYNDEDLQKLAKIAPIMTPYEKSSAMVRVCKRLSNMKNSSELIQDVQIMIPSLNIVLHTEGNPSGSYSSLKKDEMEWFLSGEEKRGMSYTIKQNTLWMSLRSPMGQKSESTDFIILVQFSTPKIQQQYESVVTYARAPYYLCIAQNRLTVTNLTQQQKAGFFAADLPRTQTKTVCINSENYFALQQSSAGGFLEVVQFLSEKETLLPLQPLRILNIAFIVGVFFMFLAFAAFMHKNIQRPIAKFTSAFALIETGDLSQRLEIDMKDDFAYLYARYNDTLDKLEQLIYKVYQTEILLQRAELKQLQSQINPHFLYNSYFLLHRTIKMQDYEKAVKFSKAMGQYFQYITRNSADMVFLKDESDHAQIYADIQAMRFEERIEVQYLPLPQSIHKFLVPKLILQPLIENSFEHGLEAKSDSGILRVSFAQDASFVFILVEDNGTQADDALLQTMYALVEQPAQNTETTAIINIHKRIKGIFGAKSGLVFERSDLGGLKIKIAMEKSTDKDTIL
ncbi:MAG: histidine kinase [Ruthenibacterium sp.]